METERPDTGQDIGSSGLQGLVIYEANPRCFAANRALDAIAARLDDIKALGTDIIWLMPVFDQGQEKAFGSPYCTRDYRKVHAAYGTNDDLRRLVSQAHDRGMKVILDIAANHTSWDHEWIVEHPDWYTRSGGQIVSPNGWSDVADLNYGVAAMRSEMRDVFRFWIEEADIDGYRCDYADGVPDDFWAAVISDLRKLKGEDLFMLAESNDKKYYADGFDATYCWNFPDWMSSAMSSKNAIILVDKHLDDMKNVPEGGRRMRFITNHDRASEKSPVSQFRTQEGALAAFVVTSMMSDCVMIYSSQEVAWPGALNFFKTSVMDWSGKASYTRLYRDYMAIWRRTADCRTGEMKVYDFSGEAALSFKGGRRELLVLVNLGGSELSGRIPMEWQGETVTDESTGESVRLSTSCRLPAYGYFIATR